ncbi:MAG TPA: hypothetical protein EYP53_10215 [Candidatus Latescibacteria bacterium]|nr:hypothetical protein [Candidatus Latescibacterota bacterium]
MVLTIFGGVPLQARVETYVIGDEDHPWQASGNLLNADWSSQPGWVLPIRVSMEQNILNRLHEEGRLFAAYGRDGRLIMADLYRYREGDARLWSENLSSGNKDMIFKLADGLQDTFALEQFVTKRIPQGVTIYVDLGGAYPVKEVKFYPLNRKTGSDLVEKYPDFDWGPHEDLYVKGYELWANDGSAKTQDEEGRPIYHLLSAVPVNTNIVVTDTSFQPQHIRYLKLWCSNDPFEIDQLEIRGEGYVRQASFVSDIIDLNDIANLGRIWWTAEKDPDTQVLVQTRVGRDMTTLRYFRINDIGEEEELTGETDEENYRLWTRLKVSERGRGGLSDTENWSPWSLPYKQSGDYIVVEGPRQYLQIKVTLISENPWVRARVDNVFFEYSQPTVARRLLGEISPRENIELGKTLTFRYCLRPQIASQDSGFDVIQIDTPVQARVESLRIGGELVPASDYSVKAEEKHLTLQLLNGRRLSSDADSLELVFDCSILSFGTIFASRAWASWIQVLPQDVEEEDPGDLGVRGSEGFLGRVIGDLAISPNPFTPNGDQWNDVANIYFKVFQVVTSAPVRVDICDFSGKIIRKVFWEQVGSSEFRNIQWDGLDDQGKLVPPGIYLVRVRVEADEETFEEIRTVAVAY